jgi:hypothetical protein
MTAPETAAALAENLIRARLMTEHNVAATFAAFVGLVVMRDEIVGRDCLIALDRLLSGDDGA